MIDYIYITLLFIHITSVIGWVGAAMFGNLVLLPLGSRFSSAARADLGNLVAPQSFKYSLRMGAMTLVSGTLLYGYVETFAKSEAVSSLGDPIIGAGALLGLLGLIIFTWSQESTAKKTKILLSNVAQSSAQREELGAKLAALQNRSVTSAKIGLALLFLVIILMVVGTNVS